MITFFAAPKPFIGPFKRIQLNAIESWLSLRPKCEVILFEDEHKTTKPIADLYKIKCIPNVRRNSYRSAYLNDIFDKAKKNAIFPILTYINSDIILFPEFTKSIELVKLDKYLLLGQRIDMDMDNRIDFTKKTWASDLRSSATKYGTLHPPTGMDYWTFPKHIDFQMPSLILGRPGVDNWMVYKAKLLNIPVIDATKIILVLHQNHLKYGHFKSSVREVETNETIFQGGGMKNMFTLNDSDLSLTHTGLTKPSLSIEKIKRQIHTFPILHPNFRPIFDIFYKLYVK